MTVIGKTIRWIKTAPLTSAMFGGFLFCITIAVLNLTGLDGSGKIYVCTGKLS